jgi:hypothetical protein
MIEVGFWSSGVLLEVGLELDRGGVGARVGSG